jgi:hypothetical protein
MFYKILSMILIASPLAATSQNPSTMVQQMHTTIRAVNQPTLSAANVVQE